MVARSLYFGHWRVRKNEIGWRYTSKSNWWTGQTNWILVTVAQWRRVRLRYHSVRVFCSDMSRGSIVSIDREKSVHCLHRPWGPRADCTSHKFDRKTGAMETRPVGTRIWGRAPAQENRQAAEALSQLKTTRYDKTPIQDKIRVPITLQHCSGKDSAKVVHWLHEDIITDRERPGLPARCTIVTENYRKA